MTEEEIEKQAKDYTRNCCVNMTFNIHQVRKAHFDGAKWMQEHAIEWHDLRKDPTDLPKENGRYLVLDEDGDYSVFNVIVNELPLLLFDNINAVAWCELPQFKE